MQGQGSEEWRQLWVGGSVFWGRRDLRGVLEVLGSTWRSQASRLPWQTELMESEPKHGVCRHCPSLPCAGVPVRAMLL